MATSMSCSHNSISLSINQHLGLLNPLAQDRISQASLFQQVYAATEELLKGEFKCKIFIRIG